MNCLAGNMLLTMIKRLSFAIALAITAQTDAQVSKVDDIRKATDTENKDTVDGMYNCILVKRDNPENLQCYWDNLLVLQAYKMLSITLGLTWLMTIICR